MPHSREPMVRSENDRFWTTHCGFLDISLEQFMTIQLALLDQQLPRLAACPLGRKILGNAKPTNAAEFRRTVPLTTYNDYLPELQAGIEESLFEKPYVWAHTSGGSSSFLRVPYSLQFYNKLMDNLMAAFILACSRKRGESSITEGDRVLYNVAPAPYLSGILADGASERFNLKPVLSSEIQDGMDFKDKIAKGFEVSLKSGVDILVGMTSVLVKMGIDFTNKPPDNKISQYRLNPNVLYRFARAWLKARIEKRRIQPKDLWPVKAIISWGIDGDIYRDLVCHYWGTFPFVLYACTEAGIIAMQNWNRKDLTPVPNCNFLEFIPESEVLESKRNIFYQPRTVLLPEVKPGELYELVVTSFHGMPFVRYRLGHLVRITALSDEEAKIALPQMILEARADDLIDIAGFTRISERTLARALSNIGLGGEEWFARKETTRGKPSLHLYLEVNCEKSQDNLAEMLHSELTRIDPFYRDLGTMMDIQPLDVTVLRPGIFDEYYRAKAANGVDLADRKPPRMNAPDLTVKEFMRLNEHQNKSQIALKGS